MEIESCCLCINLWFSSFEDEHRMIVQPIVSPFKVSMDCWWSLLFWGAKVGMHPSSLEGLKSLTEEEPKPIFGLESEFYGRPACVCRIVQGDSGIVG